MVAAQRQSALSRSKGVADYSGWGRLQGSKKSTRGAKKLQWLAHEATRTAAWRLWVRRTICAALDWPGWCHHALSRSTEPLALQAHHSRRDLLGLCRLFLLSALCFVYTTRRGKFRAWADILAQLGLCGHEQLFDLGCGRGAVLLMAAAYLPGGKAVGVDLWKSSDQSGNVRSVAQSAMLNWKGSPNWWK